MKLLLFTALIFTAGSYAYATDGEDGKKSRATTLAQLDESEKESKEKLAQAKESKREKATSGKQLNEEHVLAFVGENQPELLKLLTFIKSKQPAQYQQALREMAKSQQRLQSLAERDEAMHAVELELWNIRSQLRLVAARIPVVSEKQAKPLQEKLANLVRREHEQNLARLRLQQKRIQNQLSNVEQQISKNEEQRDELVASSLKSWQNRIAKQTPRRKKSERPTRTQNADAKTNLNTPPKTK